MNFTSLKNAGVAIMLLFCHFISAQITPDSNGIVYVTPDGTGNGTDWSNATNDLHNAIHTTGVQKVFVAIGNYNVGENSFTMKNGVEIYGGFDPADNIKTLDDIRILPNQGTAEGSALNGQNTKPVIWNNGNGLDNTAVLDGFTVKNGFSTAMGGSGIGGGIYNNNASPTFRNLVIKNNKAQTDGGGMCNDASSPVMTNCIITGNWAIQGGGISNRQVSSPTLINCTITKNTAAVSASGVHNRSGNGTFINVTVADNIGTPGFFASGWTFWKNSIIWTLLVEQLTPQPIR